jgi:hypothetical protein
MIVNIISNRFSEIMNRCGSFLLDWNLGNNFLNRIGESIDKDQFLMIGEQIHNNSLVTGSILDKRKAKQKKRAITIKKRETGLVPYRFDDRHQKIIVMV